MIECIDNSQQSIPNGESLENLQFLSWPTIRELSSLDNGNLLLFPESFERYGDRIDREHIFDLSFIDKSLLTGNIMGYVGYMGTRVLIRSRFSTDTKDYFLHYMLQKVFSINLFNLDVNADDEDIFDLLVFTFPFFLNKALRQGLYKEYQTRKYNDSNMQGRLDVQRHIRLNVPPTGKIAYVKRIFSYDNHITQLIRHTIEYINKLDFGNLILMRDKETMDNVRIIREVTASYRKSDRKSIIDLNRRSLSHPYFQDYKMLQKICLCILMQERVKYGYDDRQIHGILFDGAWLWEEYVNTILEPMGYKHPRNKEWRDIILPPNWTPAFC
jgi:5-methylcytosine-specific restriction enzyme subunit McrC